MVHRRTLSLFALICVGHVLLISAQVQSRSGMPVLQTLAFGTFARLQTATAAVADTVTGSWSRYVALSGAAQENETLRQRVLDLEGDLQREQALVAEMRALEAALGLRARVGIRTQAARVIAGSPTPGSDRVTIDQGTRDGIRPDLAVIDGRGVIGRVIGPVSATAATVQLLIGQSAAAAVVLERSEAGGILRGGADDGTLYRIDYVPALADVQPGERVTSSGQDGVYPPGFLVGIVERVDGAGTPDREILVRPAVDFSHLGLVLVVLPDASDTSERGGEGA
jgi:rod shape-determining protein MreC